MNIPKFRWGHCIAKYLPLATQGKVAEAEQLNERSQAIREKTLGPEHEGVTRMLISKASLLESQVTTDKNASSDILVLFGRGLRCTITSVGC